MKNKPINWFMHFFLTLLIYVSVGESDANRLIKSYETHFNSKTYGEVAQEIVYDNSNDVECRNPLLRGSDCSQYSCINFGHNYLETSFSDDEVSCVCPPGSYGTHCEPVNCPNSQMTYTSPSDLSMISFITYNSLMKKMDNNDKSDPFIDELVNTLSDSSYGYTSTTFGASCAKKTPIWQLTSFEKNSAKLQIGLKNFVKLMRNGNTSSEYFKLSDIYQIVAVSQPYSDVNIFTNMGITDSLSNIDLLSSLIKQTALANRLRINIFVVSQLKTTGNIYHQNNWKPLIELSETTGGFVIVPYDIFSISNIQNFTITECIKKLFTIFNNGRSVIKSVLNEDTNRIYLLFKLPLDSQNKRTGYLFISGNDKFNESLISFNIPDGSVENYFMLNSLKVYKITFNASTTSPFMIISKNLNMTLSFQLLSSIKDSTIDLGYAINYLVDSSSSLPIIDVPNVVVGRTRNLNGNVTLKLIGNSNIQVATTNNSRNVSCYFNSVYMTIISTSKDILHFSVSSDTDDYQEWIPFTFSDSSHVPFIISDIIYLKQDEIEKYLYLFDNGFISELNFDNVKEDMKKYEYFSNTQILSNYLVPLFDEKNDLVVDDTPTTDSTTATSENIITTTQSPIYTTSRKSFGLGFYSRASLIKDLINQPRTTSLINRLKQYFTKFNDFFDSYIFASFYKVANSNSIQAVDSTNYGDFLSDVMNRLTTEEHNDNTCFNDDSAQQVLIKILQNTAFEKSSDIYLITNQLYGKVSDDKQFGDVVLYNLLNKLTPRINVLLIDNLCSEEFKNINFTGLQPYWELTKKTGGEIIRVSNSSSLLEWFTYLTSQSSASYETIYSDNQPGEYIQKKDGSNSFVLTGGHTYTILGTIQTQSKTGLPTTMSIFDQNNNSICSGNPFQTIEEEFGISSPCTIQNDGNYYVQLDSNYFPTETFQVRIVEFNANFGYILSFLDTNSKQSDSPLYGVETPIKISFIPYNDGGLSENDSNLTVTIFDSTQKTVFTSQTTYNGEYSYSTKNNWFCNNANKMYYIQIKSQKESRIYSYTCLDSNGGGATPGLKCPPWVNQNDCTTPICKNGGKLIEGVCSCPVNYTGPYCDHYISTCTNDDDIYYNGFTTSLIFVVDLQNTKLDDLKQQFKYIEDNSDNLGQKEYILFTYNSGSDVIPSNMNIYVTSEKKKLFYELSQLTTVSGGTPTPGAHVTYLKAALSRQSSSKSVLIWNPHYWQCGGKIDMELVDLIVKKNVDIRIIYYNQILQNCEDTSYYLMLGNGLFTKYTSNSGTGDDSFGSYVVNGLLSPDNSTGLIVYDSYYNYITSTCNETITTTIFNNGINEIYVTLDGLQMDQNTMKSATLLSSNIYLIDIAGSTKIDITFTCEKATTTRRGYIVEGQSPEKIAYGYTSVNTDSFKNYAPVTSVANNYMYFNIKECSGSDNEFISNYPMVTNQYIYPMNASPKAIASFVNRRDICNNKWLGELHCSSVNTPNSILKIKITGTNDNKQGFSKIVTTICKDHVDCKNGGNFSNVNGICTCDASWIGQDCSIPKCYHGYNANNQQCICDKDWYGPHCNNNSSPQPIGSSTISPTTTTVSTTTVNPQDCYSKLNITLVLIFDESNMSIPYISNYMNFYSSFQQNIKSFGPMEQINLAAEFASQYSLLNSFVDITNIASNINNTKKSNSINVDRTFNSDIGDLLDMCKQPAYINYCDPQKNKYFIIFGATNNFSNDNCVANSLSILNGIKSIIFTYGDAAAGNSWWNTCYKTETNSDSENNIKIYDGSNLTTNIFETAMLDICRFENIM
uniref:EGF-like domain-containing protein n=1 Tax=Strongyloides venezuelensis TaxID=75913 RepID=A0A0K0FSK9_STRVS